MKVARVLIGCGLICSMFLFAGCYEEKKEPAVEKPVVQDMAIEPKPGDEIPMQ